MSREAKAVVTGWTVISPLGQSRERFAKALLSGQSGAGAVTAFDASGFESRVAAEVRDFVLEEHLGGRAVGDLVQRQDRKAELGAAACAGALEHADLSAAPRGQESRWAVSLGTGLSSIIPAELERDMIPYLDGSGRFDRASFARGSFRETWCADRHRSDAVNRLVQSWTGAAGPSATHFSACAASSQAIGQAQRWIQRGQADVVVCGGMDSMIHPFGMASFILLGALTTQNDDPGGANKPFDRSRDGFLIGEGAAALVLEEEAHARSRGARIYGRVLGYGASVDAHNVTAPHPEGRGAALAMARSLDDAGVHPGAVGYVNAHGTGTALNDPVEAAAIRSVFGEHSARLPVSSTKAAHGHLVAAAGAMEACVCLVALAEGRLPATLNLVDPDPACSLDHVRGQARQSAIHVAISNSFGFGGQNAALVFGRSE